MADKPKLFHSEYQTKWSESHKYKHQTTGEHCTFAAYIAEYLILRYQDAFRKPKPPYKFWSKGEPLHYAFLRQVRACNTLLKKYDEKTIIGAINSKYFDKIYYIGKYAKVFGGMEINEVALNAIESYNKEEQNKAKRTEVNLDATEEKKDVKTRRTQSYSKKKSTLNNLRKL
jgi:hypothetical protein